MDAKNYWTNHVMRSLGEPAVSAVQAAGGLSDNLEVLWQARAVIPLDDGTEADCHMFACQIDAREVLVFLDTRTGEQRDILTVVHTNQGTLTK